jgi:hypothetical protein
MQAEEFNGNANEQYQIPGDLQCDAGIYTPEPKHDPPSRLKQLREQKINSRCRFCYAYRYKLWMSTVK